MGNTGMRPDEAGNLQHRDVTVVTDAGSGQEILEIEVRGKRGIGFCKSTTGAVRPYQRLLYRPKPKRGMQTRNRSKLKPSSPRLISVCPHARYTRIPDPGVIMTPSPLPAPGSAPPGQHRRQPVPPSRSADRSRWHRRLPHGDVAAWLIRRTIRLRLRQTTDRRRLRHHRLGKMQNRRVGLT